MKQFSIVGVQIGFPVLSAPSNWLATWVVHSASSNIEAPSISFRRSFKEGLPESLWISQATWEHVGPKTVWGQQFAWEQSRCSLKEHAEIKETLSSWPCKYERLKDLQMKSYPSVTHWIKALPTGPIGDNAQHGRFFSQHSKTLLMVNSADNEDNASQKFMPLSHSS